MERRKFVKSSLLSASALSVPFAASLAAGVAPPEEGKELYELRTYELHFGSDASALHTYFKNVLIPTLDKHGAKATGVFREWGKSEPANIYLLIAYPLARFFDIQSGIAADGDFRQAASTYDHIPAEKAVYSRFTTALLTAFDGFPQLAAPANEPRIFELRTYEGYNEDATRRKVSMFNDAGEIEIFKRTGLHAVFFGKRIAGDYMPCLTYMLTFKDMEERDRNWKAFGADPDWKRISADPAYADTVCRIHRTFLEPLDYSQI